MVEEDIFEKVKQEFTDYLVTKGHRKTPERFIILKHIYTLEDHFDIDYLFNSINAERPMVSRATLYNTIELLVDCSLVIKHSFGSNMAHYERAYNNESHLHLICNLCGDITEIKDHEVNSVIQGKKLSKFALSHYSLYIYGLCSKCARASSKKRKVVNKK